MLFNACAPELWRRFTITLRRSLARQAGLTNKALAAQLRISYAKVAEYQRRGVVHFHAVIRLDGLAGPDTVPPGWATLELLTAAITQASRAVHIEAPPAAGMPGRILAWGHEHDIRPVSTTGDLNDTKVAAYVAKYATKAAECTGTLDRRITRRPARRPPDPRARPPPHRRMHPPEQASRIRRPAPGRLGAHARLQRPLLDQEPYLLHHSRRAPRRPRQTSTRVRHSRWTLARPR